MTISVMNRKPDIEKIDTGLNDVVRQELVAHLSTVLGDTVVLTLKTQVYHWNVAGPLFHSLHEMTEEQYRDLFEASDVIAERIRALGFPAPLNFADLAMKASIFEESTLRTAEGIVNQLIEDHEKMVRTIREAVSAAETSDDYATADLLTSRLDFHEKTIWMLRAVVAT